MSMPLYVVIVTGNFSTFYVIIVIFLLLLLYKHLSSRFKKKIMCL